MRPLMPPVQTPDNLFHDGNPLTGELGTIVDAEHLNNEQAAIRDTQSELIAILTAAAMEPASTAGQLLAALNKLYAPFNDTLGALSTLVGGANKLPYFTAADAAALTALSSIGRDIIGKATVADVLTYLGLGEGSALPVGVPIPWPSATPPTGWLKCNGAAFTASQYPKLALAYPALRLPDLRGEFIRGWDDGRGVDAGRSLLSAQNHDLGPHVHRYGFWTARLNDSSLADFAGTTILKQITPATPVIDFDNYPLPNSVITDGGVVSASTQPMSSTETRPRNVAFNYIVRAA
ncbi:phage tail protein [Enterobacter sp. RHBSTW-00131]|uniref:phage tail protein n=1 Tax=Enterobacter sp. RHBSTW-00131 TaxID=2742637 RepID=UPI0020177454|nr:phage tail protein [Enterobacter sp. RHBSTW-00131]